MSACSCLRPRLRPRRCQVTRNFDLGGFGSRSRQQKLQRAAKHHEALTIVLNDHSSKAHSEQLKFIQDTFADKVTSTY